MAFITQADLETRYSANVVKQWTDDNRDGTADAPIITAALDKACSRVTMALTPAYPAIMPLTTSNAPGAVKEIALSIAGYRLAGRRQKAAEHYQTEYQQAEAELLALAQPKACLVLPDGSTVYAEGSTKAEPNGIAWSSTTGTALTFTDTAFRHF